MLVLPWLHSGVSPRRMACGQVSTPGNHNIERQLADIRQELLVADPLRLPPSSVAVTALHNAKGTFLGTFLVEVGTDADAERVRKQFSGQLIDGCKCRAANMFMACRD